MIKPLSYLFILLSLNTGYAQVFHAKDSSIFKAGNKKVVLLENAQSKKIIVLKTNLQVNTDGVPTSYHPYDLRGDSIAINTILNAVAIYRLRDTMCISIPMKSPKEYPSSLRKKNPIAPSSLTKEERNKMTREAYQVFEKFRDSKFNTMPNGYIIYWKNVLIADSDNKPCIFKEGKYKGYFASATALKNDLTSNKGECDCNNQVDPFEIPTLVLAGGNHVVKKFGAVVGDLVIAYNLENKNMVYAVIGDTGPESNLGEASVILNMKLLDSTNYPKTRKMTYSLATKNNIVIGIIPASKKYQLAKPYTQANIKERIQDWFKTQSIDGEQAIKDFLEEHKSRF